MEENPIQPSDVKNFYNLLPRIYHEGDSWHNSTRSWIQAFITRCHPKLSLSCDSKILNAGSGGQHCTFPEELVYHLDIAERHLPKNGRTYVGDVHKLPFENNFFDVTVCVGSVLNYCDAATVIHSLSRVTRNGGHLFLEFETSWSLDHLFRRGFLKHAAIVETFYYEKKIRLWAYSEAFIKSALIANGFSILSESRVHIASSLIQRIVGNSKLAARFSKLDGLLRHLPGVRRFASNVIFFCGKT